MARFAGQARGLPEKMCFSEQELLFRGQTEFVLAKRVLHLVEWFQRSEDLLTHPTVFRRGRVAPVPIEELSRERQIVGKPVAGDAQPVGK